MRVFKVLSTLILAGTFAATVDAESTATVTARAGSVEVLRAGTWTAVESGETIANGEHLRTGALSSAALQLGSGKIITLNEKSEIEVRDATVKLESGRMKPVSVVDIPAPPVNNTTVQAAENPSNGERGYRSEGVNVTVINGGGPAAPAPAPQPNYSYPPYYSFGDSLSPFPNPALPTYYVYPYFNSGIGSGFIAGDRLRNPYDGIRPGQIVPPMTDPLRPPVHFPATTFPNAPRIRGR